VEAVVLAQLVEVHQAQQLNQVTVGQDHLLILLGVLQLTLVKMFLELIGLLVVQAEAEILMQHLVELLEMAVVVQVVQTPQMELPELQTQVVAVVVLG
jgi:hypothetical protein